MTISLHGTVALVTGANRGIGLALAREYAAAGWTLVTTARRPGDFVELPVAYDGLAVVVHKDNKFVDHLTVEELKAMWVPEAQGKVASWKQIRPGFRYDRSLSVLTAAREAQENTSGGFLENSNKEALIRNVGRTTSLEDIDNSVVTVRKAVPVASYSVRVGVVAAPAIVMMAPQVSRPRDGAVPSGTSTGVAPAAPGVDAELVAAVVDAVSQWKFSPALVNGLPVAKKVVLPVNIVDSFDKSAVAMK